MSNARTLWLLALALAGCSSGTDFGYAVRVEVDARASVSDDALAGVRALVVQVSGVENGKQTLSLDGFSESRQERFVYRPYVAGGGDVTIAINANDAAGALVAAGRGTITLVPGKTVLLEIGLGVDADLGTPPDLLPPPFVVMPNAPTVGRNSTVDFTASRAVTWKLRESTAGAVDAGGHYRAPGLPGIYHLSATATDDAKLIVETAIVVGFNQVTVLAGAPGGHGNLDGVGTNARFDTVPFDCSLAAGPNGILYIADRANQLIRKIDTTNSQVALVAGVSGVAGSDDGPADKATFHDPWGLAATADGTALYVSDSANNTIRKIDLTQTPPMVSTLTSVAGQAGFADSANPAQVRFTSPLGLALDADHNVLYVGEYGNNRVRSVSLATGATTTVAGNGTNASVDSTPGPVSFANPVSVTYDGAIYVSDQASATIRKIVLSPLTVTTIAGAAGMFDNINAAGSGARFNQPNGITSLGGALVLADRNNRNLRSIDKTSFVTTTIAGPIVNPAPSGYLDGGGPMALFKDPSGVASTGGNLYVLDTENFAVRKIAAPLGNSPQVTTLAGLPYQPGTTDGAGPAARMDFAQSIGIAGANDVYFSDWNNNTMRHIVLTQTGNSFSGVVSTVVGQPKVPGKVDAVGTAATLANVHSMVFDGAHTLYFADWGNDAVRSYDTTSKQVTTVAALPRPRDLALDGKGGLYVTQDQHTISKIALPAGTPTVVFGTLGVAGFLDGNGTAAQFAVPTGLVYDGTNALYVGDSANNALRRIDLANNSVVTVANLNGKSGTTDGPALSARLNSPFHLSWLANGQLLVMDSGNETVRVFNPQSAELATILGVPGSFGVRSGPAPGGLNNPQGMVALPSGELLVGDVDEAVIQQAY